MLRILYVEYLNGAKASYKKKNHYLYMLIIYVTLTFKGGLLLTCILTCPWVVILFLFFLDMHISKDKILIIHLV